MSPPIALPDKRQVRISRIAGRYLVFDIEDVALIRREHEICAVFTGTMPQAPTQNVFLGLPVELYAEEARLLVDKGAGYIVDDAVDHLSQLKMMNPASRKAYLQSLGMQRKHAKMVFDETKAQSQAKYKEKRKGKKKEQQEKPDEVGDESGSLFSSSQPVKQQVQEKPPKEVLPRVTPTTSNALVVSSASIPFAELPLPNPLHLYLNARGYFITPGLRFGGDYSVYPGDPFRYHAHYLANSYEWDQEIPMLDLLTSGRLGTAVKKSFLFGGRSPSKTRDTLEDDSDVRVFCIEWAGM